ncbi:MAG TPA: 4-hydroxy-tetrahydrodipicolinate reductase [Rhizomicrobium sp.]|nr:4-hydroxy-tetrahydrodipicolinate reductase [Rhizomicrobium sp.]
MSGIRIVVAGAAGRMGQALLRAIAASPDFELAGALVRKGHPDLGNDANALAGARSNGVALTDDPLPLIAHAQALVDFTTPEYSVELAALAAQARIVHVLGTTGMSAGDDEKVRAAARHAVIVKSGNMSLGVNLLAAFARQAAKALPDFDIEIVEMHHRKKVDAPSGTAFLLGQAAAEGRGIVLEDNAVKTRDGQVGPRGNEAIGFASLRGGTVVGEHDVIFAGNGERVVLRHVAEDRSIFATGTLAAARWGQGRKPGLYAMADVLGL